MEQDGVSQPGEEPRSGGISKLFGVITGPAAVFRSLSQRPLILTPFVAFLILSIPAGILLTRKVDWSTYYRRQLAQDVLTPSVATNSQSEIIAARVARVHRLEPSVYVLASCLEIVGATFFYWLAFNTIVAARISFRTALSIVCYALVPIMLALCYAIIALALKPDGSAELQRLAYFLPIPSPPWLVELGNSVELAWIWTLILISIGMGVSATRRISNSASYGVVFGLWLLWVLAKVGWAGLFGL